MTRPVMRTTSELDVTTVSALREVAARWGLSRSEALRRVIRAAAKQGAPEERTGEGRRPRARARATA